MSSHQINNADDLKNLFNSAANDGEISEEASSVIINSLGGTNIMGCLGTDVDDLETDDVTVVSLILDASYSMKSNEKAVRDGYNNLIEALQNSKQAGSMLVSARTFSGNQQLLYGFTKVEEINKIGMKYLAEGNSTALYDTLVDSMTGIRAYVKNLNDNGIRTKCIIVVFSDGEDNDSQHNKASDVKTLAEDFLKSEMFYLVYIGYKHDDADDLDAIAKEVGFPNVLTTQATGSEIRKTMNLVSTSIIRTSQSQIGPGNSFFT
ncbi:MAG: VWA domain-containing protein [Spirochaetales bacterium]|nr:VWA domain-containing protein [Spirochaetales bacterium]